MWGLTPQPLICTVLHDHDKPECYAMFIKGKHITFQQHLILLGVEKALRGEAPRRISVASGHGVGKDALLAMLTHWFLMTRKDAQIGATAPTADQLFDILWKEIAVWHKRLPEQVQPLFLWGSSYFKIAESPETWFARARTARKENPEAFSGLHGKYVALFGDEASGIDNTIYRSGEGSLTNKDTLVILISNPTRLEGYFYDTHHSDKANWQTFQFSSIDSPIVDPVFPARIAAKYGTDSDEYRFMVQGKFPKGDGMQDGWLPMFSEADIAEQIADIGQFMRPTYLGVDPSGMGKNKSAWAVRDAFKAKIVATEAKSNPVSVAERTVTLAMNYEVKPINVKVDNFGSGANVALEIALGVRERVHAVNVGAKPSEERFLNVRAEMYWKLREWIKKGGKLVRNDGWRELLTIRYNRTLTGKIRVMSKEDMVKKGYDSPDMADALALTFIPDHVGTETTALPRGSTPSSQMSDEDIAKATNVY